jgi:beta-glucanase (GH16 family)
MIKSPATAYVDGDGHLVIALVSDGAGGFNGARLTTQGKFSSQAGTAWEASIQITPTAGAWPAYWFMGNNGNWPANGEADVMENYGPGEDSQTTVHSSGTEGQPSKYANFTADGDFHVYRMEWTEGQFEFFRDGTSYLTVTSSQFSSGEWPFTSNGGMYAILNIAAGGSGTNYVNPEAVVLPVKMLVDYVHCWAL